MLSHLDPKPNIKNNVRRGFINVTYEGRKTHRGNKFVEKFLMKVVCLIIKAQMY